MEDKDRRIAENEHGANGVVGAASGVGAGGVLGAVIGAALGGPVGMLVGGTLGTLAGAATGYAIDYDSHEPEFREYHNAALPQGKFLHSYEDASAAYRYGWEAHDHPEHRDQTYDHIRPALHRGWTGSSDFVDYEDYIKHGWERRAASKQSGSFSPAAKE